MAKTIVLNGTIGVVKCLCQCGFSFSPRCHQSWQCDHFAVRATEEGERVQEEARGFDSGGNKRTDRSGNLATSDRKHYQTAALIPQKYLLLLDKNNFWIDKNAAGRGTIKPSTAAWVPLGRPKVHSWHTEIIVGIYWLEFELPLLEKTSLSLSSLFAMGSSYFTWKDPSCAWKKGGLVWPL